MQTDSCKQAADCLHSSPTERATTHSTATLGVKHRTLAACILFVGLESLVRSADG